MIRAYTNPISVGVPRARINIKDNNVFANIAREPLTRADWTTHDYNVHFVIGLQNDATSPTEVLLTVEGAEWEQLPARTPLLYAAPTPDGPWTLCNFPARSDCKKKYAVMLSLGAKASLFIANTLPRMLDTLSTRFDTLASQGHAQRRIIGHTLEGRELVAYVYGDPARHGTLLISSGFHPPEPDTMATEEIMKWLAGPESTSILDNFAIAVLPIANPDGYALQTQGSNAAGLNFYWNFARDLPQLCPEAHAIWQFAKELLPRGYIDFHCYTFQLDKKAGHYQRPELFYSNAKVRAAYGTVKNALADKVHGMPVTGFGTYAPHTLGSMLVNSFDTIALAKYHLHLAEGEEACRDRGVKIFRILAETLISHGLTAQAIPRQTGLRSLICKGLILWSGLIRPTLGMARRGRLKEIDFRRFAQITPETTD